ncbi:hypothetical protein V7O66_08040 [Methanolobus sp. ZRKC3]|uniref:DUF7479 domain-containing protein n=1 Tax=Methanolobus sp. ZRKC3 TaxID=3125786 RepID=UPI00324968EA
MVTISDEVKTLLKDSGFQESDVLEVVNAAEASGNKLKKADGSACLAKNVTDNLTSYAVYNDSEVVNVYAHQMQAGEPIGGWDEAVESPLESEWICNKCGETAMNRNVNMSFMGMTRAGPAIVCEKCKDVYVEADMVKTLAVAESILGEKRA